MATLGSEAVNDALPLVGAAIRLLLLKPASQQYTQAVGKACMNAR